MSAISLQSTIDVHGFPTSPDLTEDTNSLQGTLSQLVSRPSKGVRVRPGVVQLPEAGQVVRAVPASLAPQEALPQGRPVSDLTLGAFP